MAFEQEEGRHTSCTMQHLLEDRKAAQQKHILSISSLNHSDKHTQVDNSASAPPTSPASTPPTTNNRTGRAEQIQMSRMETAYMQPSDDRQVKVATGCSFPPRLKTHHLPRRLRQDSPRTRLFHDLRPVQLQCATARTSRPAARLRTSLIPSAAPAAPSLDGHRSFPRHPSPSDLRAQCPPFRLLLA